MRTSTIFGVPSAESTPTKKRERWGWYLALGVALMAAGAFALIAPMVNRSVSVSAYGWLVLLTAGFETAASLLTRRATGFLLRLLAGILGLVVGALILSRPDANALALTMLIAGFFLVGGLFRISTAIAFKFPSWAWAIFGGAITTLLGVLTWAQWPAASLLVLGIFIAIEIINRGWSWVMFSLSEQEHPDPGHWEPA